MKNQMDTMNDEIGRLKEELVKLDETNEQLKQ
jgi:hypothetical protein